MTSPVPGAIAWPIIAMMFLTAVIRVFLLNTNLVDRLTNHTIAFGILGILCREPVVQNLVGRLPLPFGDVVLLQQLSFCCIVMIVMSIYGMARLWDGADIISARTRQLRYYSVGAVLSAIIIVAGTPSRRAGLLIDDYLGWPAVIVWLAFYSPILVGSLLVIRVFGRELRQLDTSRRERALYIVALLIAVGLFADAVLSPIVTVGEVLSGEGSTDPKMQVKAWTFFVAVASSLIVGAVPVLQAVRLRLGQDRISRSLRQVEGLWQDLTDQFPDVRREEADGEAARRLHRCIIEIYDALLRLSRWNVTWDAQYMLDKPTGSPTPGAIEIAQSYAAKVRGEAPVQDYELLKVLSARAANQDLTAASDQLLVIAKEWNSVKMQCLKPLHVD